MNFEFMTNDLNENAERLSGRNDQAQTFLNNFKFYTFLTVLSLILGIKSYLKMARTSRVKYFLSYIKNYEKRYLEMDLGIRIPKIVPPLADK